MATLGYGLRSTAVSSTASWTISAPATNSSCAFPTAIYRIGEPAFPAQIGSATALRAVSARSADRLGSPGPGCRRSRGLADDPRGGGRINRPPPVTWTRSGGALVGFDDELGRLFRDCGKLAVTLGGDLAQSGDNAAGSS